MNRVLLALTLRFQTRNKALDIKGAPSATCWSVLGGSRGRAGCSGLVPFGVTQPIPWLHTPSPPCAITTVCRESRALLLESQRLWPPGFCRVSPPCPPLQEMMCVTLTYKKSELAAEKRGPGTAKKGGTAPCEHQTG